MKPRRRRPYHSGPTPALSRLDVFGRIHEAFGVAETHDTSLANASTCTLRYSPCNRLRVFFLDPASHYRRRIILPGEHRFDEQEEEEA